MMRRPGRCDCGAVSFVVEGEFLTYGLCICETCRTRPGGPVPLLGVVEPAQLALADSGGALFVYGPSGASRTSCRVCGLMLVRDSQAYPGYLEFDLWRLDDEAAAPLGGPSNPH